MPNWCQNTLKIKGDKVQLEAFHQLIKDNNFMLLSTFIPMPEELKNTESPSPTTNETHLLEKKYGAKDWYEWALKNWGVKWDCEVNIIEESETKLILDFSSPWAPPQQGLLTISSIYPKLTFKMYYNEEGIGMKGTITINNGLTL